MTLPPRPELAGLPVLETERLVLRGPVAADWPAFHAIARRLGGRVDAGQRPVWMDDGAVYLFDGAAA